MELEGTFFFAAVKRFRTDVIGIVGFRGFLLGLWLVESAIYSANMFCTVRLRCVLLDLGILQASGDEGKVR